MKAESVFEAATLIVGLGQLPLDRATESSSAKSEDQRGDRA